MSSPNVLARTLHDVGTAAWFGGSLMGAIGLNRAASTAAEDERLEVASAGWDAWTPFNLAAIGGNVVGGALLAIGNRGRIAGQRGVATTSVVKTAVTAVALGATAYARVVGKRMDAAQPTDGTTEPAPSTAPEVASAQRRQRILQWAVPALSGALVVMGAAMGEQQRPQQVAKGLLHRFA